MDLKDSHTIEALEITSEEADVSIFIVMGTTTPEVDYPNAPIGTFYFTPSGFMARRLLSTGSGVATDWTEGAGGTGASTQNLPFFRSNGSQDNILIINGALPFFRSNGTSDPITII